ncbi:IS66 family transposase [Acidithiobacillus ferrooxidans]|uniref:IS66 family transposase n=1 Tax=Acidithiobacillus ferrooxidans TaxID=920 RepID=UPI000AE312E3
MIDLLVAAHRDVADGPLSDDRMAQINADYTAILAQGDTVHPIKKRKDGTAHRRQSSPTNLLRRLRGYREEVLRFLSDPEAPFTNNIAEQAVRMPKVKQKISGCFRTFDGAAAPSARSDPIWKPYASRAPTCCTPWSNPFRGKPRSPP